MSKQDTGNGLSAEPTNWRFDADVAERFGEHAERSIPNFRATQDLIAQYSDFFLQDGSTCYDLGCSDGALLRLLAKRHLEMKSVHFIGVDASEAMTAKARTVLDHDLGPNDVELLHTDLAALDWRKADRIIAHYTLQFADPKECGTCKTCSLMNAIRGGKGTISHKPNTLP